MKSKARKTSKRLSYATEGSGNVFADLRVPNPEEELLKAQLTLQIYTILKDNGMTQVEIAKILGVRQPEVSLLMRNRAGNFSVGVTPHGISRSFASRRGDYRAADQQGTWHPFQWSPRNAL